MPTRSAVPHTRAGGLSQLLRLLLVAAVLAVVALGVQQAIVHAEAVGDLLDFGPFRPERQIIQEASGTPALDRGGVRVPLLGRERRPDVTPGGNFQPQSSLTITGFVTQTEVSQFSSKEFQIHDQDGNLLDYVPFEGNGSGDPPLNQRAKLVIVVWDVNPSAQLLTITIHDFYWPAERDLILREQ